MLCSTARSSGCGGSCEGRIQKRPCAKKRYRFRLPIWLVDESCGGVAAETWSDGKGTRVRQYQPINFVSKFGLFREHWQPKVIAEMNDYQFKLAKLEGDFVWHAHAHTDETFIVVEGRLRIDFRDGHVDLAAGEMLVVPKGVEHKPYAECEAKVLLIEPMGVVNTGDGPPQERSAENDVWI